jgi:two-component system, chemotaxis family, CheB/CheR fusion protein
MSSATHSGPASSGNSEQFYVVGIGASAGGLEALRELLHALPPHTGMAFVIVQHLEPTYESQLAEILSRSTPIPVIQTAEGQAVQPDHVFVIPPNTVMIVKQRVLHLAPRSESLTPHNPIDIFFESLAADQGPRAVGVVLSGAASDGAQGIRIIKRNLGITFSQDEESARYGGMPHSAIATGAVDLVLPPAGIAAELAKLASRAYAPPSEQPPEEPLFPEEANGDFQKVLDLLRSATKVDFGQYKQSTIRRRIGRRLFVHNFSALHEYVDFLATHPAEIDALYRDVLINVTSFFREPEMFRALTTAISQCLQNRTGDQPFRVWVPGCATGEEAYSLAITVFEVLQASGRGAAIQVFGTDISDSAIDAARAGVYPETIQADIPPERLRRYFSRVDSGFRIDQQIREKCVFAKHDLTGDPAFSQMDLVSCRNVFIYLNAALQQRLLPALHYSLKPEGLLVLGSAETVGSRSDLFGVVDNENRIFSKKPVLSQLAMEPKPSDPAERTPNTWPPKQNLIRTVMDLEGRAARILRDLFAPAGVLINSALQVLHTHGQTESYLEQVPGSSVNLLRLAREGLVHPLRKAVGAALASKQPVQEAGIKVDHSGETRAITLSVIPITDEARYCMVLFEEQTSPGNGKSRAHEANGEAGALESRLSAAERELAQTREYLRTVMEQHEAATEELRAANEEARSANEELQSTNEELRTAKEQLQSSNEELLTVNDELKHRNQELAITGNDLSNILNAATIPIAIVGMDLQLRRFTPAAAQVLGLVPGDIGLAISDLHHTLRLPDLGKIVEQTVRTLSIHQRRVQDRDGRWHSLFVRPYRTTDDRIDGAVIALFDIDDAIRAVEQAEAARAVADGIVETVQHPLLVLDPDLRVVRANAAFYNAFEIRPDDTLERTIDDLGQGQWGFPELRRLLEQALLRDAPFRDFEVIHEFPRIGRRIMRLNARRIVRPDAAGYTLLLAIEDVTDRQEAAEIQYRRLFESAKDGIIVLAASSGTVLDVNPYFSDLSHYPKEELLGKIFPEIAPFRDAQGIGRLVSETIEQGVTHYDSVRLRGRDGSEVLIDIIGNCYRVKEGSFIQVNLRDVTERRRNEEALRQSNLDLQQFAFAASHDLQEPLRTIINFAELFQTEHQGKLGTRADEQIYHITTAAARMRQLVLDLVGFSQVARAEMKFTQVSVESVLSTVILNLQMAIESSHATITFDPLPIVRADETQLLRLLQNLIGNSIKYRGPEPPRIHLAAQEAGPEWIFSVRDNGIGIDPKYYDYIFTVFKRLHGREYPGTGIGLAVCKRVVERHGGRIWVESKAGEGSTFYFTLPKPKQS